ncbi:hypothetical protein [Caulobacter sp. B11]|uniref:hypothetical protein n=1 Tax=Caulobacter sp. B11 TaxID=2048899 RepID=UPI001F18FFE5|nr:hypothetical protein [Caulobacter sp. B11]
MLEGVKFSFQDEAEGLFGVRPPIKPLESFDPVLARIDKLVPARRPGQPGRRVPVEIRHPEPTGWTR